MQELTSKNKRAGLYARVSTKEQTVQNQLLDLRRFCESRHFEIVQECSDIGISGSKDDRPGLRKIMALARKRQIDVLVVHRLDRLFRSLKHLVHTIGELNDLGIALVSFSESIDLTTAQGKLTSSILGALGEFERSLIQERILSGLRRARAQGKQLGRPSKFIDVEKAKRLRAEGWTFADIGKELGISREGVRKALANNPCEKSQAGIDGEVSQK